MNTFRNLYDGGLKWLQAVSMERRNLKRKIYFLCVFIIICCLGDKVFHFLTTYKNPEIETNLSLHYLGKKLESIFVETLHDYYGIYQKKYKPFLKSKHHKNLKYEIIQPKCRLPLDLLVLVLSAPENIKQRLAIRYSWGEPKNRLNQANSNNRTYKTLFVIGKSKHDVMIRKEAEEFNDILYLDLIDNYRHLSYKTLNSIIWISNFCRPNYLLKTDDDCYVNVLNLFSYFDSNPVTPLYSGRVQWFMPPNRDKTSKFYLSEEDFNGFLLPPYVSGGGILMSGDLLSRLVLVSEKHPVIPNEDANIGLLMHEIGVGPQENIGILPFIYCEENLWLRPPCDFLHPYVIHGVDNYSQIWLHFHISVLQNIKGICLLAMKLRQEISIPLYCPTDNS